MHDDDVDLFFFSSLGGESENVWDRDIEASCSMPGRGDQYENRKAPIATSVPFPKEEILLDG